MLADRRLVGDAFEQRGGTTQVVLGDEAAAASLPPAQLLLLYRLVRALRPAKVVEFGTAFGVSGSAVAAALRRTGMGQLVTVEAARSRQEVAQAAIEAVAPGVTTFVCGFFDDHLVELDGATLFLLDGNHYAEPTRAYLAAARDQMARPALIVLDDVHFYSAEMDSVWHECRQDTRFSSAGEVDKIGFLALGELPLAPATAQGVARVVARLTRRLAR